MQEIFASLASPAWWFSATLVALVINLISAYAKPATDRLLSKFSTAWRNRSDESRRKFEQRVEILLNSPQALSQASEAEVRARLRSIQFFTFVIVFLLFTVILSGASGSALASESYSAKWILLGAVKFLTLVVAVFAAMSHREAMQQSMAVTLAREFLVRSELKK